MARRIPETRFDDLVRGATRVFIEAGYRRTQMADVANEIGVAKGTLYGYVESKDALFALCLAFADATKPIPLPEPLPLETPPAGEIGRRVAEAVGQEIALPRLEAALSGETPADVAQEAREIVGELFDLMHARRFGIKLLDRCMDQPELAGLWQSRGREEVRAAIGGYLAARKASGRLRTFEDPRLAARMVIEICTTWA
ncbi:MAG: TetR/AcrR family transcriptional regulator, partial [Myxococcota bacterium]